MKSSDALLLGLFVAGVVLAVTGFAELANYVFQPTCVRLTDADRGWGLMIDRRGMFMQCHSVSEDSLDVECRKLEVKPCAKESR